MSDDFDKLSESAKEDGSVWTSYSDMFTTMAIIFLVMFVFALIKLGVTTLENVAEKKAHKDKLEGLIPEGVKQKTEDNLKKMNDSIDQVAEYKDVVDHKIKELSSFVTRLEENKNVMKEMVSLQKEKEAMIENLRNNLKAEKEELKSSRLSFNKLQSEYDLQTKDLNEKVEEIGKLENVIQTKLTHIQDLKQQIESDRLVKKQLNQQLTDLDLEKSQEINERKKVELERKSLKEKIAKQETVIEEKITNIGKLEIDVTAANKKMKLIEEKNSSLARKINETEASLEKETMKGLSLEQKLKQQEFQISQLNQKLAESKVESTRLGGDAKGLQKEVESLKKNLTAMTSERNTLKFEIGNLKGKMFGSEEQIKGLQSQIGELATEKSQMGEKIGQLNNSLGEASKSLATCEDDRQKLKHVSQALKESQQDLRGQIARKLARKFKEANINVKVNLNTGSVTLLTGKNLLFEKNSVELKKNARKLLNKIIPLYAEVLFSDELVKSKIASFNLEGHASPNFKGRYVNPNFGHARAYAYNLELSARRAAAIGRYIYGDSIGDYDNKTFMRKITQSIGFGYIKPVKKSGRTIASENCGEWSCPMSQRVELSFTLQDDQKTIQQILNFQEKGL